MSDAGDSSDLSTGDVEQLRRRVSMLEERLESVLASHENLEATLGEQAAKLEVSQAKWRSLAETAVDFIVVLDRHSRISFLNQAVMGVTPEQVQDCPIYDFVPGKYHDPLQAAIEKVLAGGECVTFESQGKSRNGQPVWYSTRVGPFRNRGRIDGTTLYVTDITKRRLAEEALRESDERLRLVVQNMPVMLDAFDADGNIIVWNHECEKVSGYSPNEILNNRRALELLYPDPEYRAEVIASAAEPGDHYLGRVWELTSKDGSKRSVLWSNMSKRFQIPGWHSWGIGIDITDRKAYENRLKAERETLEQLLAMQENERKLISYEIHDGFLQEVVGAKMILEGVFHRMADGGDDEARQVEIARECLGRAVDEGRRLINDLRPIVVEEQGLAEAIRTLVDDERAKGGLEIELEEQLDVVEGLTPLVEGVVFRIVQEALNNVRRHGETDRAAVHLRHEGRMLAVEISDEGVGFDPGEVPPGRFGLEGIRKRAALFGGSASIESAPGRGTAVRVRLPLSKLPQPGEWREGPSVSEG